MSLLPKVFISGTMFVLIIHYWSLILNNLLISSLYEHTTSLTLFDRGYSCIFAKLVGYDINMALESKNLKYACIA